MGCHAPRKAEHPVIPGASKCISRKARSTGSPAFAGDDSARGGPRWVHDNQSAPRAYNVHFPSELLAVRGLIDTVGMMRYEYHGVRRDTCLALTRRSRRPGCQIAISGFSFNQYILEQN